MLIARSTAEMNTRVAAIVAVNARTGPNCIEGNRAYRLQRREVAGFRRHRVWLQLKERLPETQPPRALSDLEPRGVSKTTL
jgi:hypothetical protein